MTVNRGSRSSQRRFPPEMRERAVRMVMEAVEAQGGVRFGAVARVARELGIGSETLRVWVPPGRGRPGLAAGCHDAGQEADRRAGAGAARGPARERDPQGGRGFLRAGARPALAQVGAFIACYGAMFGVEPICRVLQVAPSSYYAWRSRRPSARSQRDEDLKAKILACFQANRKVYGARKVWLQLHRDGTVVARCTVERLMRALGIAGAVRGRRKKTTTAAAAAAWPADLLDRDFTAAAPDRRWVADITYVPLAAGGFAYAAFITDLFSRTIVGWKVSPTLSAALALDALEMAVFSRVRRTGRRLAGLVHHSDRGGQYLSIAYSARLAQAGAVASVGSKGDSYDNAIAE